MKSGRRLWRTADGGLVEDGHPAAVSLAYGPDDEVAKADEGRLPGNAEPEPAPAAKAARPAANKARRKPTDK